MLTNITSSGKHYSFLCMQLIKVDRIGAWLIQVFGIKYRHPKCFHDFIERNASRAMYII